MALVVTEDNLKSEIDFYTNISFAFDEVLYDAITSWWDNDKGKYTFAGKTARYPTFPFMIMAITPNKVKEIYNRDNFIDNLKAQFDRDGYLVESFYLGIYKLTYSGNLQNFISSLTIETLLSETFELPRINDTQFEFCSTTLDLQNEENNRYYLLLTATTNIADGEKFDTDLFTFTIGLIDKITGEILVSRDMIMCSGGCYKIPGNLIVTFSRYCINSFYAHIFYSYFDAYLALKKISTEEVSFKNIDSFEYFKLREASSLYNGYYDHLREDFDYYSMGYEGIEGEMIRIKLNEDAILNPNHFLRQPLQTPTLTIGYTVGQNYIYEPRETQKALSYIRALGYDSSIQSEITKNQFNSLAKSSALSQIFYQWNFFKLLPKENEISVIELNKNLFKPKHYIKNNSGLFIRN